MAFGNVTAGLRTRATGGISGHLVLLESSEMRTPSQELGCVGDLLDRCLPGGMSGNDILKKNLDPGCLLI